MWIKIFENYSISKICSKKEKKSKWFISTKSNPNLKLRESKYSKITRFLKFARREKRKANHSFRRILIHLNLKLNLWIEIFENYSISKIYSNREGRSKNDSFRRNLIHRKTTRVENIRKFVKFEKRRKEWFDGSTLTFVSANISAHVFTHSLLFTVAR